MEISIARLRVATVHIDVSHVRQTIALTAFITDLFVLSLTPVRGIQELSAYHPGWST